jgi:Leucine-rich repeat (LRR) protein
MKSLLLLLLVLPMFGFAQIVNIPDANFKSYLVNNKAINTNGDNQIQVSEASAFNGAMYCNNLHISNLTGIEAFTALTRFYCRNNQLTSLDVSKNTALIYFCCDINQLTSLDVRKNTALTLLSCDLNQLRRLNVSKNTTLISLSCYDNQLTSLDLRKNTALTQLLCGGNRFDCDALRSKYGLYSVYE